MRCYVSHLPQKPVSLSQKQLQRHLQGLHRRIWSHLLSFLWLNLPSRCHLKCSALQQASLSTGNCPHHLIALHFTFLHSLDLELMCQPSMGRSSLSSKCQLCGNLMHRGNEYHCYSLQYDLVLDQTQLDQLSWSFCSREEQHGKQVDGLVLYPVAWQ